jgi:hypothetical protein
MVKKIKKVDVSPTDAIEEPQPVEEAPHVDDDQPIEEVKEEVIEDKPIKGPEKSKPLEYITCENCNKQVLMKTYKYSHKKVCKASNVPPPPPPPPPPPTPEPEPKKAKPKRIAKPKEKKEEEVPIPKPQFDGTVSFNELKPVFIDPYIAMRNERVLMRQQRVRSLISQAI